MGYLRFFVSARAFEVFCSILTSSAHQRQLPFSEFQKAMTEAQFGIQNARGCRVRFVLPTNIVGGSLTVSKPEVDSKISLPLAFYFPKGRHYSPGKIPTWSRTTKFMLKETPVKCRYKRRIEEKLITALKKAPGVAWAGVRRNVWWGTTIHLDEEDGAAAPSSRYLLARSGQGTSETGAPVLQYKHAEMWDLDQANLLSWTPLACGALMQARYVTAAAARSIASGALNVIRTGHSIVCGGEVGVGNIDSSREPALQLSDVNTADKNEDKIAIVKGAGDDEGDALFDDPGSPKLGGDYVGRWIPRKKRAAGEDVNFRDQLLKDEGEVKCKKLTKGKVRAQKGKYDADYKASSPEPSSMTKKCTMAKKATSKDSSDEELLLKPKKKAKSGTHGKRASPDGSDSEENNKAKDKKTSIPSNHGQTKMDKECSDKFRKAKEEQLKKGMKENVVVVKK
ncbi:hypothetical protein LXA43DRAFT_1066946 [Ganoderma leucocontextum]|nr:hypothetical protein LXA43DRAFT_1066946 [Ganoderma leucocontextum]